MKNRMTRRLSKSCASAICFSNPNLHRAIVASESANNSKMVVHGASSSSYKRRRLLQHFSRLLRPYDIHLTSSSLQMSTSTQICPLWHQSLPTKPVWNVANITRVTRCQPHIPKPLMSTLHATHLLLQLWHLLLSTIVTCLITVSDLLLPLQLTSTLLMPHLLPVRPRQLRIRRSTNQPPPWTHCLLSSILPPQGVVTNKQNRLNGLKCLLFNSRSVMNKLPDLHNLLYNDNYDCIFVTESWLYPEIPSGILDPEDKYTVFRSDRRQHRGGGVLAFISKQLRCQEISLCSQSQECFPDENVDILLLNIACMAQKYRFMLIYRKPIGGDVGCTTAVKLCSLMNHHLNSSGPTFVIGDLNCPGIDWTFGMQPPSNVELIFHDFFLTNGFIQCVTVTGRCKKIWNLTRE